MATGHIRQLTAAEREWIGPTRSDWYDEAIDVSPANHKGDTVLWACRYRELVGELANRLGDINDLYTQILLLSGAATANEGAREAHAKALEIARRALWIDR